MQRGQRLAAPARHSQPLDPADMLSFFANILPSAPRTRVSNGIIFEKRPWEDGRNQPRPAPTASHLGTRARGLPSACRPGARARGLPSACRRFRGCSFETRRDTFNLVGRMCILGQTPNTHSVCDVYLGSDPKYTFCLRLLAWLTAFVIAYNRGDAKSE